MYRLVSERSEKKSTDVTVFITFAGAVVFLTVPALFFLPFFYPHEKTSFPLARLIKAGWVRFPLIWGGKKNI